MTAEVTARSAKAVELDGVWYPVTRNAKKTELLLENFVVEVEIKELYGKRMVTDVFGARDRFGWNPENHEQPNF